MDIEEPWGLWHPEQQFKATVTVNFDDGTKALPCFTTRYLAESFIEEHQSQLPPLKAALLDPEWVMREFLEGGLEQGAVHVVFDPSASDKPALYCSIAESLATLSESFRHVKRDDS